MYLKSIQLSGFKSFAKKSSLEFTSPIAAIVGPNGSGKSNAAEAFRFVLGEQSMKSMRGKKGPDLIWGGVGKNSAANRARVAVTFDNKKKLLDVDFDEVVIERVVFRDGTNEYSINGSKVRLKDVVSLLAEGNIGASGHHIISQGESDRILGASPKERREMIEDALGLKAFQYKKQESVRKLEKTGENLKEVKSLRREVAPHLRFLEKQMQKLERARELQVELREKYKRFLLAEGAYVNNRKEELKTKVLEPQSKLNTAEEKIALLEVPNEKEKSQDRSGLDENEKELAKVRTQKVQIERNLGRVEGQLSFAESHVKKSTATESVSSSTITKFLNDLEKTIKNDKDDVVEQLRVKIGDFRKQIFSVDSEEDLTDENIIQKLKQEKSEHEEELAKVASKEEQLVKKEEELNKALEEGRTQERRDEKYLFELKQSRIRLKDELKDVTRDEELLLQTNRRLEATVAEAQSLLGRDALSLVDSSKVYEGELPIRSVQEDLLRDIERTHARLDETGVIDEDTVSEFEETKKRDAFLEQEVADLETSRASIESVLERLEKELESRFAEGLQKINSEFQNFFSLLFDGGSAKLTLTKRALVQDDEDEGEEIKKEGIDINVKLPRKKITTLDVLSGGERALTSIALIFAMSQVNPPPFIILDETDAALDEANSVKYADMVKKLSKHSQLILITHNRQTMEAAGELYGITMGRDGESKILSVKFDEAVEVAK